MLLAAPARFMDDHRQQHHHQSPRYRSAHQQQQQQQLRTGFPVLHEAEGESLPESMTAGRHDHHISSSTAVLPSSSPQELLGLADLPPPTAGAIAATHTLPLPRGRYYPPHQLPHHLHHHHHQQQHHFNRHCGGSLGYNGSGTHGGSAPPGEDDFEFLRNILLDAGDGAAHAVQHGHALRPLGGGVAAAAEMAAFAPIVAAKSTAFAAVTSAPQALNPILPPPSSMSPAFVGALTATASAGDEDGEECMNSTTFYHHRSSSGGGGDGGAGGYSGSIGGSPLVLAQEGTGGGYHVTEEERIQAADDVAQCIWLAGDTLRDVLLSRLWEMWGTVEAEMSAAANANTNNNAAAGGSLSPSSHSPAPAPRKSFNETLVEKLKATCKAVEAEIEAAKASGDDTALCTKRPQQWRGGAALRSDVLARLEAYKRNNQETCGDPGGSGHGRFTRMNCMDDLERLPARPSSNIASAGNGGGGGELMQGLETALEATRGMVKSELLTFGDDGRPSKAMRLAGVVAKPAPAAFRSEGGGGDGGDGGGANRNVGAVRRSSKAGGGGGGGTRDRRNAAAAAAVAAVVVGGQAAPTATGSTRKKNGGGGGAIAAAAAAGGSKKRKRSGNGRRCKHEGCLLHPHFGLTRPEYCSKHKLPGMFNVKGRRCVHHECTRTPVYGKAGDPHPTYCAAHKPTGYVDIKNPTCRDPNCFRQPSFGSASDRKATYCASHMLNGMVNVRRMLASFKSASLSAAGAGASAGAAGARAAGGQRGAR